MRREIVRRENERMVACSERQIRGEAGLPPPVETVVHPRVVGVRPVQVQHVKLARPHQPGEGQRALVAGEEFHLHTQLRERRGEERLVGHTGAPVRGEKHLHCARTADTGMIGNGRMVRLWQKSL